MPRFHGTVAQRRDCDEQRARKHRQRRIRVFDEDAAVTVRRRRSSKVQPVRRGRPSDEQSRAAIWQRIKDVFPGDSVAATSIGNREHEIAEWIDGRGTCP